jgi:hypothetical protein
VRAIHEEYSQPSTQVLKIVYLSAKDDLMTITQPKQLAKKL